MSRTARYTASSLLVVVAGCAMPPSDSSTSFFGDDRAPIEQTQRTPVAPSGNAATATIRGQSPTTGPTLAQNPVAPGGSDQYRYPMPVYGEPAAGIQDPYATQPNAGLPQQPANTYVQQLANPYSDPQGGGYGQQPAYGTLPAPAYGVTQPPTTYNVQPTPTYANPTYANQPIAPAQPPIGGGLNYQGTAPGGSVVEQLPPPPGIQPFPGVLAPGEIAPAFEPVDPRLPSVDLDVFVDEERTGRFMFGMGVNSDLGVTGQIVIDERNFDWRAVPTSVDDVVYGKAFRGGGQGFRIEAMPGTQFQRYMFSFTQPYLYLGSIPTPFSFSLSGFLFDRRYFDWDEERLGGRVALGYRVTHDLSLSAALRAEQVEVSNVRLPGLVPELDSVVGENSLYSGRLTLTHDTRDRPFIPTEGHMIELSYEQVFGSFDYPRAGLDVRKYFLMRERPDGSGRHTLAYSFNVGVSGSQTPVFENYFAGGFSTMRGFDFRGASPVAAGGVVVGGEFQFLGSVEYLFPITADDMVKGVVFCDYGTVEEGLSIDGDDYRISPGAGLRISIPAMGPAPLALDLAFPVAHSALDDIQHFSFFFGFGR